MGVKFTSDNQPKGRKPRGKTERTKLLEAMQRAGKTEEGFYDLLMEKAFNPEDSFTFKELLNRLSPLPKSVNPLYSFDLPKNLKPHERAVFVLDAIAEGIIPSDIGNDCIQAIKATINIEEHTDLKERIEKLEKALQGES